MPKHLLVLADGTEIGSGQAGTNALTIEGNLLLTTSTGAALQRLKAGVWRDAKLQIQEC